MQKQYEVVVIGGGAVGVSTLFYLAELGCTNTLLLDRGAVASGGTGKSCAIVRTHYSILSNTELAAQSLAVFRDPATALDDPEADCGFVNSGYLILAGEGDTANHLVGNLALQRRHGAKTEEISEAEALRLHPLLHLADVAAIGYEPESGYADPRLTAMSFARAATKRGATIRTNTPVTEIVVADGRVEGVRTADGEVNADVVVAAAGPWTRDLTDALGIDVRFQNYRHTVLTLRTTEPYRRDLPIVKDLTVQNKMYFRPESETVLVGTGDYGAPVADPDDMDVQPDEDLVVLQARQIARRMPSFEDASIVGSWFGPYDITPDWNPVIDAAPDVDGLYLAFGFSGHGFKLAPAVGKMLAQRILGLVPDIDIDGYRLARFAEGGELVGVYGAGSIS